MSSADSDNPLPDATDCGCYKLRSCLHKFFWLWQQNRKAIFLQNPYTHFECHLDLRVFSLHNEVLRNASNTLHVVYLSKPVVQYIK